MAREAIFIGYRRDDTADVAGRIYDAMAARFGRDRIFKDVDNLRPGADFGDYIRTILPRCRVVLVLIGPNWLEARDETGRRRLDDPQDWVRIEIETALNASGLDVVPVLVNGARMPRAEELPQSLHPLLRRHAAIIRRDPDFHDDVARLSTALRASVQTGILDLANLGGERKATPARSALPRWALLVGATAAIAAVGFYLLSGGTTKGREFDDCNGAGWCPRMIVIPAGRFTMGSPPTESGRMANEGPQHVVAVRSFAVGKYDVTFDEWAACVSRGGCTSNTNPSDQGWGRGNRPVINVSWNDAQQYVQWLSQQTGQTYRLLSEAEWEYAARAGTETPNPWSRDASREHANFGSDQLQGQASGRDRWVNTSPVGSFPPNAFGLYDMQGNVDQWLEDCWHADYNGAPTDGSAWTSGDCSSRVTRGTDWQGTLAGISSAARGYSAAPSDTSGFRVARTL